jgi:hypothetical protein
MCPVDWIETLSAMGRANPFFERAGFTRVGVVRKNGCAKAGSYGSLYGSRRAWISADTVTKSRFSAPVYYVFDNRSRY